jgi:hypothetical protein
MYFAHNYTWNHFGVFLLVGRSLSKHEHCQQLQHNFLSVRLFWQTNSLGFKSQHSLLQCLALTISGNSAEWLRVRSVALVTTLLTTVGWGEVTGWGDRRVSTEHVPTGVLCASETVLTETGLFEVSRLITIRHTHKQTVRLLCTSDQSLTHTATYTRNTTGEHPSLKRYSNPRSKHASARRPMA